MTQYDSAFAFFVEYWWYGVTAAMCFHFAAFLTKCGWVSYIWGGDKV